MKVALTRGAEVGVGGVGAQGARQRAPIADGIVRCGGSKTHNSRSTRLAHGSVWIGSVASRQARLTRVLKGGARRAVKLLVT